MFTWPPACLLLASFRLFSGQQPMLSSHVRYESRFHHRTNASSSTRFRIRTIERRANGRFDRETCPTMLFISSRICKLVGHATRYFSCFFSLLLVTLVAVVVAPSGRRGNLLEI